MMYNIKIVALPDTAEGINDRTLDAAESKFDASNSE